MRRLKRSINSSNSDNKGFTLVETMIAMLVFSVGILGIAAMQTTAINSNTLAEDVQQNTVGAMAAIEELMATDDLDQRLQVAVTTCFPAAADPRYNICVDPLPNSAIPNTNRVIVTSAFTPKGGRPQTVTMTIFKPTVK